MAVTGVVHPDELISNASGRAGDALVLTKPLGAGAVSTALKKGFADADLVAAVVGAADGTAERDPIGCIAANERVLHVEVRVGDSELGRPLQLHALCRVFRQEPVRTVEHFRGEVGRYVEHVQVAGAEHQYLRI